MATGPILSPSRRLAALFRVRSMGFRYFTSTSAMMIQTPRSVLQPPSINLYPKSSLSSLLINRRCYGSGLTLPDLQDRTLTVVKLFDKVNPDKVTLEAHFINDLGLDSLDTVEIVMAFEDEFGVEISDEEAEKIFTCNDAVELLKVKMDVH